MQDINNNENQQDLSMTKINEKQNSSAVLRPENVKPRTIGVPESVSPKNMHVQVVSLPVSNPQGNSSEQLDKSIQGESADSNYQMKPKVGVNEISLEPPQDPIDFNQRRQSSKHSLKRSTFKVNEGKFRQSLSG